MSDDLLADFVAADRENGLGTYGICVQRAGEPATEHRFRSDDRVNLYSVSKTFTSVALGVAEGRLTLDDRFLDHMPELRTIAADGFEDVTLRHLLTDDQRHRPHVVLGRPDRRRRPAARDRRRGARPLVAARRADGFRPPSVVTCRG